nr:P3 [Hardenbergia mosaic virus]
GDGVTRMRCETALIKGIFKPKVMLSLLNQDPYIALLGMISPTILVHMYRMRHLEEGIKMWIDRDQEVAKIFITLEQLTRKVVVSELLIQQMQTINDSAAHLIEIMNNCKHRSLAYAPAKDLLTVCYENNSSNASLRDNGYLDLSSQLYMEREKIFLGRLKQEWRDLNWREKSSATWQLKKFSPSMEACLTKKAAEGKTGSPGIFVNACFSKATTYLRSVRECASRQSEKFVTSFCKRCVNILLGFFQRCYGDILYLVNICIIFSLLLQMVSTVRNMIASVQKEKALTHRYKMEEEERTVMNIYCLQMHRNGKVPTLEEFRDHLRNFRPDLIATMETMIDPAEECIVNLQ